MGSWDFESGLADDFDLDIERPYFAYNVKAARGGEPQIALHLEGKAEGGTFEEPTHLADETALFFTVGKGWMITEDGAKLVHETGMDRGFQVNTAIARLLKSAIDAGAPLRDRGDATEAGIWKGLKLHFKRRAVQMGGEIGERQVLFVEKYLGEAESGGTKTVAKPKAAPKAEEKAPAGDDITLINDAVGGAIFKRLQKLAASAEDYDTFAAEASELPKVKDDDGLQEIILDEARGTAVWEALRQG